MPDSINAPRIICAFIRLVSDDSISAKKRARDVGKLLELMGYSSVRVTANTMTVPNRQGHGETGYGNSVINPYIGCEARDGFGSLEPMFWAEAAARIVLAQLEGIRWGATGPKYIGTKQALITFVTAARPLQPLVVDKYGAMLALTQTHPDYEIDGTLRRPRVSDLSLLPALNASTTYHPFCGERFNHNQISEEHNRFFCPRCGTSVTYPLRIRTFGELRAYLRLEIELAKR